MATACSGGNVDLSKLDSLEPLLPAELQGLEIDDHQQLAKVTFLVVGDAGTGKPDQQLVGNAMSAWCGKQTSPCDFVTVLGDNIYGDGVSGATDKKFQSHFEAPYEALGRIDMWMVAGNHDWYQADSVKNQIRYSLRSPRWRMPLNHYAVPNLPSWLNIYALDTTVLRELGSSPGNVQWQAAANSMIQAARDSLCGRPGWRILLGHHPIYSSGKHALSEDPSGVAISIKNTLGDLISECDIQLYMSGHDHHQELISTPNLLQLIQGAGGANLRSTRVADLSLEGERWAAEKHGFAMLTATENQLAIHFIGSDADDPNSRELCAWQLSVDASLTAQSAKCALR